MALTQNNTPSKDIDFCTGDIYSLNFDGVNDYATSNAATPFTQWDIAQAWTFFVSLKTSNWASGNKAIISTKAAPTSGGNEILIGSVGFAGQVFLMRGSGGDLRIDIPVASLPNTVETLQISYDGSGLAAGVLVYADGADITGSTTITSNALAGTLINPDNAVTLGRQISAFFEMQCRMRWISFVNYVKTPSEVAQDHANRVQAQGGGAYLFALDFNQTTGLSFNSVGGQNIQMDIVGQVSGDWVIF